MNQLINIVLVEDDPDISIIVKIALKERANLDICYSIDEAHARLKGEEPQLILLDYLLQGGNGLEFVRELRRLGNKVPVIFLTARAYICSSHEMEQLGILGMIHKPFDPLTLYDKILGMCDMSPSP
jgi:DNA-binding response OmpR family regulator